MSFSSGSAGILTKLLTEHLVASFDKQFYLSHLVGEADWGLNLHKPAISFGQTLSFSVQILGTESYVDNTWLWGWASPMNFGPEIIQASLTMKTFGEQNNIPEFTKDLLPISNDGISGHYLSLIASGVCGADAYYRCPYQDGAAFVLIYYPPGTPRITLPVSRVAETFLQVISNLPYTITSHREAFVPYLRYRDMEVEFNEGTVIGHSKDGDKIAGEFDDLGRLTELKTKLQGQNKK